jgi:hypothetical protein
MHACFDCVGLPVEFLAFPGGLRGKLGETWPFSGLQGQGICVPAAVVLSCVGYRTKWRSAGMWSIG